MFFGGTEKLLLLISPSVLISPPPSSPTWEQLGKLLVGLRLAEPFPLSNLASNERSEVIVIVE